MKFAKSILIAIAFMIALSAQSVRAQSCQTLLNDLVNHASTQDGNDNYVGFQMAGNREAKDWAQYTTGVLRYYPGHFIGFYFLSPRFYGDATQSFSDRLWSEPPPPGGFFGVQHPFSPYATDKLRVSFNLGLSFLNGGSYGDHQLRARTRGRL